LGNQEKNREWRCKAELDFVEGRLKCSYPDYATKKELCPALQ